MDIIFDSWKGNCTNSSTSVSNAIRDFKILGLQLGFDMLGKSLFLSCFLICEMIPQDCCDEMREHI